MLVKKFYVCSGNHVCARISTYLRHGWRLVATWYVCLLAPSRSTVVHPTLPTSEFSEMLFAVMDQMTAVATGASPCVHLKYDFHGSMTIDSLKSLGMALPGVETSG